MSTYGFRPSIMLYSERCPHCDSVHVEPENIPGKHKRLCGDCLKWYSQQEATQFGKDEKPPVDQFENEL